MPTGQFPRKSDPAKHSVFTCAWCGKQFTTWTYRKQRFCSRQCNREWSARQPKPITRRPENFVTQRCVICGTEYTVHKCMIELRHSQCCSNECRYKLTSQNMRGERHPHYRGGSIKGRGPNWGSQKRAAMKRDGGKCAICGRKKRKGEKWALGVHHIRPYRDFNGDWETANQLSNLITLCKQCHTKVEFGKLSCPRRLF